MDGISIISQSIYIYIMDTILIYIVRGHVCGQYLYINQHNICSGCTIHEINVDDDNPRIV